MPFIRTPKGVKMPFSPAKISELISLSYREVYGKNSFKYRGDITRLTKDVIDDLKATYGNEPSTEWHYFDMLKTIKKALMNNIDESDVYYAFMNFYEIETSQETEKTKTVKNFKIRDDFDPAWNIYIQRKETQEEFLRRVDLEEKKGRETGHLSIRKRRVQISLRQSQWRTFIEKLSEETYLPFDPFAFIDTILKERNTYSFNVDKWHEFWTDYIFSSFEKDPRNYSLLSVIEIRRLRYDLIGGNWLLFSGLNIEEYYDLEDQFELDYFKPTLIKQTYGILFKQFITTLLFADHMNSDLLIDFDLNRLSEALIPENDRFIDWRSFQYLKQSGSLLEIPSGTQWKINKKLLTTEKNTYELPQFAYMRLAIALASIEKSDVKTDKAIEFYKLFSQRKIIPTATMLREAGKAIPNYLEDQASIVADKYENIWESINETIIGTKWTGTVTLDWREVRAKDSPINNGLRFSYGILPFLKTIDTALNAQEQNQANRSVTNIIPIWHRDAEIFINREKFELNRFNSVLSLSDLFIVRAKNAQLWTMFDPKIYPEILEGTENGYLKAENAVKERSKKYPKAHKQKRADKILKKIIDHMYKGTLNIVFDNNNRAFNLYQESLPQVNGLEGVGSFIIHKNEEKGAKLLSHWTRWPALTINIFQMVNDKGIPDLKKIKEVIGVGLRILDNTIIISQKNETIYQDEATISQNRDINDFRHVCLGLIGLNETIDRLTETQNLKSENEVVLWIRALASAWETSVLTEEQLLVQERGVADLYAKMDHKAYFNPISSVKKLNDDRNGSFGLTISSKENEQWTNLYKKFQPIGHRFLSKTIYAPFVFSSALAGVNAGGLGVVMPIEKVLDPSGKTYWTPTHFLLKQIQKNPMNIENYGRTFKYPENSNKWSPDLLAHSHPSPEDWRKIMMKAASIRQWFDQGVCLTLSKGIQKTQLLNIIEQAWFFGLSSIRFINENQESKEIYFDEDSENEE